MNTNKGFTLLELLVVIGITGILIGLAAPSFSDMMRNSHMTTITNELVSAMNTARSEAIKRGKDVNVTPTNGAWNNGFKVLDGTTVIREYAPIKSNYSVSVLLSYIDNNKVTHTSSNIVFNSSGMTGWKGSVVLCETEFGTVPTKEHIKAIDINLVGRLSIAKDGNGNGIPEIPNPNTNVVEDIKSCVAAQ